MLLTVLHVVSQLSEVGQELIEFASASNKWAPSEHCHGNHDSAFNFQLLVLVFE